MVREIVESMKFCIVYDVLVWVYDNVFLFNDCFYVGFFFIKLIMGSIGVCMILFGVVW